MKEKMTLLIRVLTLVAVVTLLWWLLFCEKDNHLSLESDSLINPTPEQIQSIKSIGEWEFLSISTEELVDTVRRSLLRRDELARIYYGTLRLGFNMKDVEISTQGDSVLLTLPRIGCSTATSSTRPAQRRSTSRAPGRHATAKLSTRKPAARCCATP